MELINNILQSLESISVCDEEVIVRVYLKNKDYYIEGSYYGCDKNGSEDLIYIRVPKYKDKQSHKRIKAAFTMMETHYMIIPIREVEQIDIALVQGGE